MSTPSTRKRIDTNPYSVIECLYSEKMAGGRMAMSTDATTPTEAKGSSAQKFTSRGNRWRTNIKLQATASGGGMYRATLSIVQERFGNRSRNAWLLSERVCAASRSPVATIHSP